MSTNDSRRFAASAATVTIIGGTLVVVTDGGAVRAAEYEVTNTNATGAGSLERAIEEANEDPDADTITFSGDALSGTIDIGDTTLRIKHDVTIVGPGRQLIVTNSSGNLLYLYNDASLTLSGITLDEASSHAIGGNGASELVLADVAISKPGNSAIALSDHDRTLELTDVDIDDPEDAGVRADDSGNERLQMALVDVTVDQASAGVEVDGVNEFSITDTIITGSTDRGIDIDTARRGGLIADVVVTGSGDDGIYIDGDSNEADLITVERVDVADSGGTGMYLRGPSSFVVRDVTIEASDQTGFRADDSARGVDVARVSVSDSGVDGMAIYDLIGGDVQVSDVTIADSGDFGLGVLDIEGNVSIANVEIENSGEDGMYLWEVDRTTTVSQVEITGSTYEGLHISDMSGPTYVDAVTVSGSGSHALYVESNTEVVTVTNSTFAENTQSGAYVVEVDSSDLVLSHSTVASNTNASDYVFVVDSYSTLLLDHTIVVDNDGDDVYTGDGTVTAEYSLFDEDSGFDGTNLETDDALLGPLADNGGFTQTLLPAVESPAVDAGDLAIDDAPDADQLGGSRISGSAIDIGSVELPAIVQSIAPTRFADTRDGATTFDGESQGGGKRNPESTYEVQIAGRGGVPADAASVVINVTAVAPDAVGYVTAYPCDAERPLASSLNYAPGSNVGNEIVAGLSADGKVCLFSSQRTHLTVDVVGYATSLSRLQSIVPARAFETRLGEATADGRFQNIGRLSAGSQQKIAMRSRLGVPADAAAVVLNITAIRPSTNTFVTVHPCLPTRPLASSLNVSAGQVRGNEIIAQLDDSGDLCVYVSGDTDLTIDLVGYLPEGGVQSVPPARILETRTGQTTTDGIAQGGGPVAPGSTTTLPVAGRADVPSDVKAVVVNVTAINPSSRGYVTVSPCVLPTPTASSLNYEAGVSGGNEIIAEVNDDGEICLFSSSATHLAVDVVAYIR
ncbi:right-handed parallel beta-helix repeat-containing protein [Ilumatobacter coccineus]|uniref:Right handed beta helix domain-containing protein n=1 Tax=Ilumatobacter coccineus (strain NBRC 103263 / KCTC 29153 / YM16-304) TaxID=1313172 RepID=A0A6C7EDQ1_ILUCY|nr:right-handed parallel beta-helix repeat-containing protein [Ilumatobacter coccineus]BAN03225.1 hypothetical protein YM304_29110 [Ilumatobacter coccineus YM16-304]